MYKRLLSCLIALCLCFSTGFQMSMISHAEGNDSDEAKWEQYWSEHEFEEPQPNKQAPTKSSSYYSDTSLSAMRSRAEAIVNYTWTPTSNITTWNGNSYNGKTYFPAGTTVKGVPYTLFTSEVVSWSLCSLEQYKTKASSNYSATAYCVSVGATRSGPVYGSCCADLVCEVFGGNFMNGSSPRYHNVGMKRSEYATTTTNVKISDIRAGDAISNTSATHIMWVGEVTDTQMVIYEQTPPVARKVTINKASCTNSNGYFTYGGSVYNIVTKSNAFSLTPPEHTPPATPNVTASSLFCVAGGTISFSWDAVAGATGYWVHIYNENGSDYVNEGIGLSTNCTYSFPKGKYVAYFVAYNDAGDSDGCRLELVAYDGKPQKPNATASKTECQPDETITFTWNSVENATGYWIHIYDGKGADFKNESVGTATSCSYTFPEGEYAVYIVAYNPLGDSDGCRIGVSSRWITPDTPQVVASKTACASGESITFSWNVVPHATGYWVHIYDSQGNNFINESVGTETTCTYSFPAGEYSAYFVAYNHGAESESCRISIISYGSTPALPIITGNKGIYLENEAVTLTWSLDRSVEHYWVHIYKDGEDYENHSLGYVETYTNTFPVGEYTLYIASYNPLGENVSSPAKIVVKHNYVDTATAPTCTAQGYTTHTCSVCGDSYKDTYTAALGHNYSYAVTTKPTTSATGVLTGTCPRCKRTTTVTLPKLDTTDYSYSVVKAATCTATGTGRYTWKTTTYGSYYFDVTIAKTAHNYTATVTAPTCTAQGYTTHTCTACGDSYKDTYTSALGHNYSYKVTTEPTTSATGVLTGTCSRCSGTTTVTLPKLNTTDYNYSIVKAATCTATGTGRYTWKTTTYGSFYFDVTIAKTAHNYTATVTAPSCTTQGYTTHICSDCGDSYKDTYTAALGHNYSYKVTNAPTTSATGALTGTCSRCSGTTTVTLPKLNTTDYSYSVVKAATCTATGTGRYTWKTTTYGSFYFDVTIAKTAHNYTATVTAPTCTAQGYTTHICTACGDSYKDTYTAALGHNYTASVTAPTCTEQGYTTHTCTVCGDSYRDTYTAALGHAWDNGTVTTQPTATENGVKTFTCTRCNATRTESIPATGNKPCDGGENCPSGKFVDVNTKEWYHPYVDYAVEHGLFGGTSENTFEPESAMTRAMLVTVLWRYEGKPMGYQNTFSDVNAKNGSWYIDAVAWAAANGIVGGVGNNKFDPDGNITREQMATILFRYAKKKGIDTSKRGDLSGFPDGSKVESWAKDAVQWTVAEGIIGGSDGKLLPQGSATRAQVATILMRYIEKTAR